MTTHAESKMPITIETTESKIHPIPSSNIPLRNFEDVRRQMGQVFREMRSGSIEMSDGTKLTYVLGQIAKLIEIEKLNEAANKEMHKSINNEAHEGAERLKNKLRRMIEQQQIEVAHPV